MSKEALKVITDSMYAMKINYSFMEQGCNIEYPYFTGEYQEIESISEDGMRETQFMITGFSRESWTELENAKENIAAYFSGVSGKTVIAENGSAVAVFYGNSLVVPTGDAELKRIQINLTVKEWRVKE